MSTQDRFAALWTDYLEGELDDRGAEELRELLRVDESLVQRAADLLQTHRLLGLIVAEGPLRQDEFVRATLGKLPKKQDEFVSQVMSKLERTSDPLQVSREPHRTKSRRIGIAAALVAAALLLFAFWPRTPTRIATDGLQQADGATERSNVRLTSSAHARFFGELSPPVGSALARQRDYVLMSGLVELSSPAGASAILEGPAVFRVLSDERLALDVGRCSVHTPDGAEGFRVDTPVTQVVDRGTRFAVNVTETSETEVQVIEGAADIHDLGRLASPSGDRGSNVRLTNGEARRFATTGAQAAEIVPFDATTYRGGLPDRVISYRATTAADGGAENLISVTIQRGGEVVEVPVEDVIRSRVVWFKATRPRAFLCGNETLPSSRVDASSDDGLVTGVINPDGSTDPLTTDAVLEGESGTPGLAIRFERPVINGPGADVVLFDLQTFTNPPDGDAFHVSPLVFREGLKSHTIRKYDLTMESPEALELTDFHVYHFEDAVDSAVQLDSLQFSSRGHCIRFRGLAVGIDLSDLGYAPGETVDGLFFQDALDDEHRVDPVLIFGLPAMK